MKGCGIVPCYKTCPLTEQYIILELSTVMDLIYDQAFFCFRCRVAKKEQIERLITSGLARIKCTWF